MGRNVPPARPDPEEIMEGTCGTCRSALECLRMHAAGPVSPTGFGDLPSAECPRCGARVYLMRTGRIAPKEIEMAKPPVEPVPIDPNLAVLEKLKQAAKTGQSVDLTEADLDELDRLAEAAEIAMENAPKFILDDY
jgi:rRNA maturation endonuclease Nob1